VYANKGAEGPPGCELKGETMTKQEQSPPRQRLAQRIRQASLIAEKITKEKRSKTTKAAFREICLTLVHKTSSLC
jgi:hypothetical protein